MKRYYITDRRRLTPEADDELRQKLLLKAIKRAATEGVEYIQLRERDLDSRALEELALKAAATIRRAASNSKLLVNSRIDIAIAAGADGVHLRSQDISASEARSIFSHAGQSAVVIAVSCHSRTEVESAYSHGADFVVLGPIFESHSGSSPLGVKTLRAICKHLPLPIFALGGVTEGNTGECMKAGAAGVAGIRLFQQGQGG